jgi:hypothetical protein
MRLITESDEFHRIAEGATDYDKKSSNFPLHLCVSGLCWVIVINNVIGLAMLHLAVDNTVMKNIKREDELDALRAELEALRADAQRYRILREKLVSDADVSISEDEHGRLQWVYRVNMILTDHPGFGDVDESIELNKEQLDVIVDGSV